MEFTKFIRKPFVVDAVEVTKENIAEVAKHVGILRMNQDGEPYISVNRDLFPNIFRVEPGFYMTKMGDNIRCYSPQVFTKQFVASTPDLEVLFKTINNQAFDEKTDKNGG